MDNLDRDIREAQRLGYGVHYGRYKADHPHTKPVPIDVSAKGSKPQVRICKECGCQFEKRKGIYDFCSDRCRGIHRRKMNLDAQHRCRSNREPRNCQHCGNPFLPTYKDQIYCGRSCAARAKGQLSGVFYTCSYCGEQFKPKAKTNKYCNVECYRAALKNKPAVLDIEL